MCKKSLRPVVVSVVLTFTQAILRLLARQTRLPGATDNTRYGEGRASPRSFLTQITILNAASARMLRVSYGVVRCVFSEWAVASVVLTFTGQILGDFSILVEIFCARSAQQNCAAQRRQAAPQAPPGGAQRRRRRQAQTRRLRPPLSPLFCTTFHFPRS